MNPQEQRQRHTAVATAERQIEDLQTVLLEMAAATVIDRAKHAEDVAQLQQQIADERTHRLKLADEQRAYVDNADRLIMVRVNGVLSRGFWQRVRWIATGK